MVALAKVADRDRLKPRRDPYWTRLAPGAALGYRKMHADSVGSWTVRCRDPETGKQSRKPLGEFAHLPPSERFDAAAKAAHEWLAHFTQVGKTDIETVGDALDDYVKHLRKRRGDAAANDAEQRFKRLIDDKLAKTPLAKLAKAHMLALRSRIEDAPLQQGGVGEMNLSAATRARLQGRRSGGSINRDLVPIRAALNLALANSHVATSAAWERALAPIRNASKRRTGVYLDRDQRAALIAAALPDLAAFIRGLCAVPLRPGALAALTAADFDRRQGLLTITKDKSGAGRSIKLPASAVALMIEQSRNKLPTAPLFGRATGSAWSKNAWAKPFRAAAAAAGLPTTVSMYALRHSTISDLVAAGVDLVTVATISGTGVAMIEKHYAHVQADVAAAALAKLAL